MAKGLKARIAEFLCGRVWRVRKRVVFLNHVGRGFKCNPKYAAIALKTLRPDIDVVWMGGMSRAGRKRLTPGVRYHSLHGFGALRLLATARVWVDNTSLLRFTERGLLKKPGQTYIQTWHGSMGPKKMAAARERRSAAETRELGMVDYTVSNSRFETGLYRAYYPECAKPLEFGHPRNDVFFGEAAKRLPGEVRRALGVPPGVKLFLYAPTFRDSARRREPIRARGLLDALAGRFGGEWMLLFRPHPKDKDSLIVEESGAGPGKVRDVSCYDDIQELMVAADAMATDYSGCIYDFVLSRKPGFIYAPDIAEFGGERGLYYPLSETPFPIAETPDALEANVRAFNDAAYAAKAETFLAARGCVEDGKAAARLAEFISGLVDS